MGETDDLSWSSVAKYHKKWTEVFHNDKNEIIQAGKCKALYNSSYHALPQQNSRDSSSVSDGVISDSVLFYLVKRGPFETE